ncbi:MAG: threonine synthase [Propionibacteriaceae bacterium]|nr:threonine synthase [Propionibacteriaceae bacterium]
MRYVSTRATDPAPRPFSDILLEGLAPDGGLYLPVEYPQVTAAQLAQWRELLAGDGYARLAFEICSLFIDDIPAADLRDICERAYAAEKFLDPAIVPVSHLADGLWLAHLSNGPSAAFKDMAMQLLGELFSYELARRGEQLTILGATSGDTGSAAEYALLGKPGVRVVMLSPADRMTPFQQAQMYSLDDPSIVNLAVEGVFDDCQDLVKAVNADADFKARHRIGAVNSINWARLLAQVVYYFAAWLRLPGDDEVAFAVPSGNFGNIAAGHIARQMGLPIRHLVLATNENNVLDEFFRTGVYRVRGAAETHATSSPSMDISKASNFERFVADLLGRDGGRVAHLFGDELPAKGQINLAGEDRDRFGFISGSSTHADRLAEIRWAWQQHQVLIDPHTADGVHVARELLAEGRVDAPVVVLETALPVKFAETITEATGGVPPRPERFADLEKLPQHVTRIPVSVTFVKEVIQANR